jgi:xanthine/CO dehydrogenase XdhC/CoxF family maturation factor
MIELDTICREASERRQDGEELLLATVVRIEGSSYRRPGARMLVGRDRRISGCVSGGCLEDDVVRRAEYRLRGANAVVVRYDSTSDDDIGWGFGVGCNGVVEILIERLDGASATDPLRFAESCFAREEEGVIATVFASRDASVPVGARLLMRGAVLEASSVGARQEALLVHALALEDDASRQTAVVSIDGVDVFLQKIQPIPHVFVIGSRHDVTPLLAVARAAGLRVTIVDKTASVTTRDRFRDADRFVTASPDELRHMLAHHHTALAVVMSHDYERDREYLAALLGSNARYIGMLGPERRTSRMLAELACAGVFDRARSPSRIHAPVGLAIGAETPREIALAIVAEMLASLAGAPACSLRVLAQAGAIHSSTDAPNAATTWIA